MKTDLIHLLHYLHIYFIYLSQVQKKGKPFQLGWTPNW